MWVLVGALNEQIKVIGGETAEGEEHLPSWAIVGAGGIGITFATMLCESGHNVYLVCRAWQKDALQSEGAFVTGLFGEHHSRPTIVDDVMALPSELDIYAVATKAYDTETVANSFARVIRQSAVVVSLQNGLGNVEALMRALPHCRVLGARIIFGAERIGANMAKVTVCADDVVVAPLGRSDWVEDAKLVASSCNRCGIPCRSDLDIAPWLWAKVLYNSALNPLGALLNMTYGELAEDALTHAAMNAVIEEAFSVASAVGAPLRWRNARDYMEHFYGELVPPTAAHRSSMLQDLEAGRRTEIDALNGAIVRLGKQHGIHTPVNSALTEWVKRSESGEKIDTEQVRARLKAMLNL
ncbi:MAG: ketopantoate reductase family protein [Armatimonadota bacterium]|nr:ketopantoate reductase family protein [Armatimonadota bacterium]MCX7777307.1 ketopantoate reductase family protein [Armatimonadota bacterium]MDW8024376.1 ketopantoate reductase family protein [Armatimonadota bacterium]